MAIVWGNTSGYFRLGMDVTGSGTTRTIIVYGQSVGYGHNWSGSLVRSGVWSGSKTVSFYSARSATVTKELYRATVKTSGSYKASISYWNGSSSITRSVTVGSTTPTKPATPTGIKITRSSAVACTVSCNSMARATSYEWQQQLREDGNSWTSAVGTSTTSSPSLPRTGMTTNLRVRYRVRARNAGGVSSYSSATDWFYTTPDTPTDVEVFGDSLDALFVSFKNNALYPYGMGVRRNGVTLFTVGNGTAAVPTQNVPIPGTHSASDTFQVIVFAGPESEPRGRAYSAWSASSAPIGDTIMPRPVLVASATRGIAGNPNPLGTQILVTAQGSVSTAIANNRMTLRARYRLSGASSWGAWTTNFQNLAAGAVSKRTFALTGTIDPTLTYEVQVELSDTSQATVWEGSVSTGRVAFSLSKTGAAVGKIWNNDSDATLQVDGHLEVGDPNVIVIDGVAYQQFGSIQLTDLSWGTAAGGLYHTGTITVPMPYTPPPGWRWAVTSYYRATNRPNGVWIRTAPTSDSLDLRAWDTQSSSGGFTFTWQLIPDTT